MKEIKIIHLIYTFAVALFAGLLYTFEQGVLPTLNTLTGSEYAKVEQGLIYSLDKFPTGVIVVASIAMLLPIYTLIKLRKQRKTSFWKLTFAAWLLFFFGVGLFTILLNVPINNYVKTWDIESPPADWEDSRDAWNALNHIRTPINFISLMLLILASFELYKVKNI